ESATREENQSLLFVAAVAMALHQTTGQSPPPRGATRTTLHQTPSSHQSTTQNNHNHRPAPPFSYLAIRPNPPHRCPKNNPRLNRSFIINPIDQYPFTEPNHPSHHPKLQITIHHSTTISGAAVKPRSRLGPWRSKESVAQGVRSRGEVGGCGEGCSVVKRTEEPRRCPTMAESMAKNWVEK
ncbi:hypothetical protein Drorol1_Dr00024697, partial [Drosera rotundifolia]